MSRRNSSRVLALAGLATTFLVCKAFFASSSVPARGSSSNLGGTPPEAMGVPYADFLGQKARSLASSWDLGKHISGKLGALDHRQLQRDDEEDSPLRFQEQRQRGGGRVVAEDEASRPPSEEELQRTANRRVHEPHEPVRLCPECDCLVAGSYAASPSFAVPVPKLEPLRDQILSTRGAAFNTRSVLRYLLHHIPLSSTLDGLFMKDSAISMLLTQQFTCPDALIAHNFTGLSLDKPTLWVYTRTGPAGRLRTWDKREPYMQRHVETIKQYNLLIEREGHLDGSKAQDKQLMWVLVEDDAGTEPGLETLLRESGIPFLYFAHGPTRHYGKAQWNIVLRAIEVMRDGFFGDGPVMNIDDDSKILPELLRKLWKLKKATAFLVGNLHSWPSKGWWEGPFYENGNLTSWEVSWKPDRVFPIDMNGFAINSSQIGPGLPMSPPQYIPFDRQAGESEFLEQIYPNRTDIEPLCDNTVAEGCYYAWHNAWIKDDWEDALPGE